MFTANWSAQTFKDPPDKIEEGTTIGSNTYNVSNLSGSLLAQNVTSIAANAFKDITMLVQIKLPKDCNIHDTAFTGCENVYVFAPAGGTTEAYCYNHLNVCKFVAVNTEDEIDYHNFSGSGS